MLDEYMELAGTEVINSARAAAYAGAAGIDVSCDTCGDDLAAAVGDDPYDWYGGVEETAPWWDPTQAASSGFLGVLGLGVTGLEDAQVERQPVDLIGDGAALGPLRRKPREMAFTVGLIARDECALSYGIGWLAAVLRGGACGGSVCRGDQMCMFSCCPTSPDGVEELRHLYDVGLMEGPAIEERTYVGSGIVATAKFTLVAGLPWIFSEPLPGRDWVRLDKGTTRYGFDPDQVYDQCPDPTPCVEDPDCKRPRMPPRPPVPRSPCLPKGKSDFRRTLISVDPRRVPDWFETVPVVELEVGSRDMRRLIVRFWSNPSGANCKDVTDPCAACFDVSVPFLPKGSVLTVDGRTRRAEVECPPKRHEPAGSVAVPQLYGPRGRAFEWPTFICPTGVCVEVLSERTHTAKNARVRVQLVARGDAA